MAGLALGSYLAGRFSERLARPVLVYGILEVCIGLYGLVLPSLIGPLNVLYSVFNEPWSGFAFFAFSLARFASTAVLLIIPTTLMGATLPILSAALARRRSELGLRIGTLYSMNTAGAVVGIFTAGFLLMPGIGVNLTNLAAVAGDAAAGLIAIAAGRRMFAVRPQPGDDDDDEEEEEGDVRSDREPVPPLAGRAVLAAYAVSGFTGMALQVIWTRSLAVVIGSSVYSFTIIVLVFLAGITAGSLVYSRYSDWMDSPQEEIFRLMLFAGVTSVLGSVFIDRMPVLLYHVLDSGYRTSVNVLATNAVISGVVMLLPTFAFGAMFPTVMSSIATAGEGVGRGVGRAYFLNTLGCILGSFLSGFVMIPTIGLQRSILLIALLNVAVGTAVRAVTIGPERRMRRLAAPCGLVIAALSAVVLMPRWDIAMWTSGLFRVYEVEYGYRSKEDKDLEILYYEDGLSASVTVERFFTPEGKIEVIGLRVNGKVDASNASDMPTQILSGIAPLLLHEHPEKVALIGYGSGVTAGAILKYPVKDLTLMEIESRVIEGAKAFAEVNHNPLGDPRMSVIYDDGRNVLSGSRRKFDVIISEPSNPWMTGASNLFTKEFFELARRRLDHGGILCQWVQLYELSSDNIKSLFRTFNSVFPYVLIFTPYYESNDTLLLGSAEPLLFDFARVSERARMAGVKEELADGGVDNAFDLMGLFIMGFREIGGFSGEGPLNTDDNMLLEFSAPFDLITFADESARLPFIEDIQARQAEALGPYLVNHGYTPGDKAEFFMKFAEELRRNGREVDAAATEVFAERMKLEIGN